MGFSHFECGRADLNGLVRDAQEADLDDTPAMNEIIRRFEPLTERVSRSLTDCPFLRDDLANAARLSLVKAVRGHDLAQPTFAGYAASYMRGAALRERKRWLPITLEAGESAETSLEPEAMEAVMPEAVESAGDTVVAMLAPWGDGDIAAEIEKLNESQQHLMRLRYIEDAPLNLIADEVATSVPAVSQRLSTIHRKVEMAIAA